MHVSAAAEVAACYGLAEPSQAGDCMLLRACTNNNIGAFLCLRCRVSGPLEQKLSGIYRQFGRAYDLDLITMAGFVLDDAGQLLSFTELKAQATTSIRPFTAQVVCSFDPQRGAGLPHWARTKLQAHAPLKSYLREQGVLLYSPWSLLAKSSGRRIREALEFYGVGALTSDRAVALHQAYCARYQQAKADYRQRTGRSSGWVPSDAFLLAIAAEQPAATTREQLLSMDRAVRTLLGQHWHLSLEQQQARDATWDVADSSTLDQVIEPEADIGNTPAEQLALIHAALERAMASSLPAVIAPAKTDPTLLCLWQGFGEGLTNTPLAERCGCARGTVSKKLRPEQLATSIATAAAVELKRHAAFASVAQSVDGAERLVEALRNHLLTPEREGDIAPLRRAVAQALTTLS